MKATRSRLMLFGIWGVGLCFGVLLHPTEANDDWVETTAIGDFDLKSHAGDGLAMDGDTLVFGANTYSDEFSKQGMVRVYLRNNMGTPDDKLDDQWVLESELFPSDPGEDDRFGKSVCLRGDTLFVSSPRDDDGGVDAGAIYRFERVDGQWFELEKFTGSDTAAGDWFGIETKIEENVLVVGAIYNDNNVGINAGAAYVFRFSDGAWEEEAKLTRTNGRREDRFGRDVHVQGNEIFVSTQQFERLGNDLGTIQVFGYSDASGWVEKQTLSGSDSVDRDGFGFEFEVHGDRLVSAAAGANLAKGKVYVFARDNNGTSDDVMDDNWVEQAIIEASDGQENDRFGRGLEIGRSQIIVGAWDSSVNVPTSGSMYVYDLDDKSTPSDLADDQWIESNEIEASNALAASRFGSQLLLYGESLVVGDAEYGGVGITTGQVYVFEKNVKVASSPSVLVVDSSADALFSYKVDGDFYENSSLVSGNNTPTGLTTDTSGNRWVIDRDDYVYAYDKTATAIGSWKALGLQKPEGITTDGTHIWIVDRGTDRVYYFENGAERTSGTSTATSSFALISGNKAPRGIHTDGSKFWVVNATRNRDQIYVYNLAGFSLGYWELNSINREPRGVTISNSGDLITVDIATDKVYKYVGAADRLTGSQNFESSFKTGSGNLSSNGIAFSK